MHGLFLPQVERMDALIEQLQSNVLGGGDLIPGLLSQPGVTPELVGEVFAAALKYYRAEPWVALENEDLLAVQGVAAGRRALGEAFFKDRENLGHFWGILSTRPYMRAMEGLAHTQWELDQREESLKTYRELLRLNPNDNQGIRYVVMDLLLEMGRDDEARKLLSKYKGVFSANWAHAAVLLAFKKEGDVPAAQHALQNDSISTGMCLTI